MFTESQKLQKHQAHLVAALLLVHLFWWKSKRKERVSFLCFQNIENLYIYILQIMLFQKDLLHPHQWKSRFCKGNKKVLS